MSRASMKAIVCGQLLSEKQAELADHHGGTFVSWLKKTIPEICSDTAYRWIAAAKRTHELLSKQLKQLPDLDLPLSEVLSLPVEELPAPARQAKQLYLDFTAHKTIADCIRGVVMEGDDDSRLARAGNGKLRGGAKGVEKRKDAPKHIGRKLTQITSHLIVRASRGTPAHARNLNAEQLTAICAEFGKFLDTIGPHQPRLIENIAASSARHQKANRAKE